MSYLTGAKSGIAFGILYVYIQLFYGNAAFKKLAKSWVNGEAKTFGSFSWCCAELGLSVVYARHALREKRSKEILAMLKNFEEESNQ